LQNSLTSSQGTSEGQWPIRAGCSGCIIQVQFPQSYILLSFDRTRRHQHADYWDKAKGQFAHIAVKKLSHSPAVFGLGTAQVSNIRFVLLAFLLP